MENKSIELTQQEIYQVVLALACRTSYLQARWACALNEQEALGCLNQINLVEKLGNKFRKELDNNGTTDKR